MNCRSWDTAAEIYKKWGDVEGKPSKKYTRGIALFRGRHVD